MWDAAISSIREIWTDGLREFLSTFFLFRSKWVPFWTFPSFCPWHWYSFPSAPGCEIWLLLFFLSNHLPGLVYSSFTVFFPLGSLMCPPMVSWVFDLPPFQFNRPMSVIMIFQNYSFTIFSWVEKHPNIHWWSIACWENHKLFHMEFKVILDLTPTSFFPSLLLPLYLSLIFCSKLLFQPEVLFITPGFWFIFLPSPLLCPYLLPGNLLKYTLFASLSTLTWP